MTATLKPLPELRHDIRRHDSVIDVEGTRHRVVRDWLGRGRDHQGYVLGNDAAAILDLVDGRPESKLLDEAKDLLGDGFGRKHLKGFLAGLDAKLLLDTEQSRDWLEGLRQAALAEGSRPAAFAGTGWYPNERAGLKAVISELVEQARENRPTTDRGRPRAIVAPHAGFSGSGSCAARAFAELEQAEPPRTVILLGPNHCYRTDEVDIATVPFDTPLGRLESDGRMARALAAEIPNATHNGLAQFREHSLEMELPFLQFVAEECWRALPRITPIIVSQGFMDGGFRPTAKQREDLDGLARALADALEDPKVLLVVSGDLTHYGPSFNFTSFADEPNAQIEALDREALNAFTALDAERLLKALAERNWCGGPSFYVLTMIAKALKLEPVLVDYLLHPEESWRESQHTTTFAAMSFVGE